MFVCDLSPVVEIWIILSGMFRTLDKKKYKKTTTKNMVNVNPLELWGEILSFQDEHPYWRPALLIVDICICAPCSSATLERLFSQMNQIKTLLRNRLNNASLNAILRIRISEISLQKFHDNFVDKCVNCWYNIVCCVM